MYPAEPITLHRIPNGMKAISAILGSKNPRHPLYISVEKKSIVVPEGLNNLAKAELMIHKWMFWNKTKDIIGKLLTFFELTKK